MAYSKFNYQKIRVELGIETEFSPLFSSFSPIPPTNWLDTTLNDTKFYALFSEKARSEGIVFPILIETCKRNAKKISLYSGAILSGDEEKGLNGECDFILSKGKQSFELRSPLFCMIEAEDNDIEKNIPQCIAQMEGARLYNEREGVIFPCIYGCVTTGLEWQFLKLENKICYMDTERYFLDKPENILGVLQTIIDFFEDL